MLCTVTVRRLKPGAYEAFREAVVPVHWPAGLLNVSVLRNTDDPDEVCTIGYLDLSGDALEDLRDTPELLSAEHERLQRVAEHVDEVLVNTVYEVVDDLRQPAG